jgi:RNA polymerase sigma factor (sigma-70 family)
MIQKFSQSQLIKAIKTNNPSTLKSLYVSNYPKIESFVLLHNGTKEDAKDIYQEAFITVWNNIKNNAFIPLNETAIQGYLYTISKNKWMDVLKSSRFKKTTFNFDEKALINKKDEVHDDFLDEKLKSVMEAFKNMGAPCKELLTDFYYKKKSLKIISIELNIEENTVRNKKYRCMEKLRALVMSQKT